MWVILSTQLGETILAQAAERLESEAGIGRVDLYRTNVDYAAIGTTWGCHESYLSRRSPAEYAAKVVPHLVSRIVYTGSGGFDNLSPSARFALSPRAFHLNMAVSNERRIGRAIFSLRNDPLSSSYHRVHLVCGEPNCSELSTYLKIGTTALVLAMADARVDFGIGDDWLVSPLGDMPRFALDTECKTRAQCRDGKRRTAIDIQRHYLELAERHCGVAFMPPWAGDLCAKWREVLDQLEANPEALVGSLDWPTKLALFKQFVDNHSDLSWNALPIWSSVSYRVSRAIADDDERWPRVSASRVETCLGNKGQGARLFKNLSKMLQENGLDWYELDAFYALRDRLCEFDLRYGQLYPRGIFLDLEDAGEIRHRMLTQPQIDAAMDRAPESGRARVRGDWVRRLATGRAGYCCDWTFIRGNAEHLDLSDPFVTEACMQSNAQRNTARSNAPEQPDLLFAHADTQPRRHSSR